MIALVRGPGRPTLVPKIDEKEDDKDISGIRCPACQWRPTRHDMWSCDCGEVWNTFATRGECPGCQRRWAKTQCTKCGTWSDHDAWYEDRQQRR
jgi:hypothetical protein